MLSGFGRSLLVNSTIMRPPLLYMMWPRGLGPKLSVVAPVVVLVLLLLTSCHVPSSTSCAAIGPTENVNMDSTMDMTRVIGCAPSVVADAERLLNSSIGKKRFGRAWRFV